jgi:Tfp pilus assembly protein PilO
MKNLSKREKTLLIALCIAVLGYFYYTYIAVPQLSKLNSAKTTLSNNKLKLNSLKETEKSIDQIKKQVEDLDQKVQQISVSVPDSSRIPEIILFLKDIGETQGTIGGKIGFGDEINKINSNVNQPNQPNQPNQSSQQNSKSPNAQSSFGNIITIPIDYDYQSDYSNMMAVLNKIENSNRKMFIDKISIIKDNETGKLSINLNMNCYFFQNNNISGPINYPFLNGSYGKQNIFN